MNIENKSVMLTGPTATGKTRLAVELAREFRGEIVSADSRQVYLGMDIGTGKDISEYSYGADAVPYHLIDIVSPLEEYNLMRFKSDAEAAINDILRRKRLPIVAGGSPLYVDFLLSDYELSGAPPEPRVPRIPQRDTHGGVAGDACEKNRTRT